MSRRSTVMLIDQVIDPGNINAELCNIKIHVDKYKSGCHLIYRSVFFTTELMFRAKQQSLNDSQLNLLT
jgi:hypothetical protein